jgi:uncharacterized protein YeaO (DUF488 family)
MDADTHSTPGNSAPTSSSQINPVTARRRIDDSNKIGLFSHRSPQGRIARSCNPCRGRGLSARRYDVWMANLAPSEDLLNSVRNGVIGWGEFSRRYRKELREAGSVDKRNRNIKNHGQKFTLRLLQTLGRFQNVTLMCHCDEDQKYCHRHLLRKILDAKIM